VKQKVYQHDMAGEYVSMEIEKSNIMKILSGPASEDVRQSALDRVREIDELMTGRDNVITLRSISKLYRENPRKTIDLLVVMIVMMQDFLDVTEKMEDKHVNDLAVTIISDFGSLTLEDVALCLKNGKTGKYGKLWNRINGSVVYQWLTAYTDDQSRRFQDVMSERHEIVKDYQRQVGRHSDDRNKAVENGKTAGTLYREFYKKGLKPPDNVAR